MKENQQNEKGTDKPHSEKEQGKKMTGNTTLIGKLAADDASRHIPANEQTGEERA